VEPVPLPDDAPVRLAELRARSALTMPGCCVLLAAQQMTAMVTTLDARLAAVATREGIPLR
jgi:hypothetical protein